MANRVDSEPCEGGRRVTRVVSTDADVTVPETLDGVPVVSVGPSFLGGSPAVDGRTVRIPATVRHVDPEAFEGTVGIRRVEYGGSMEEFSSFGIRTGFDCEVVTGDGRSFAFMSGYPMCFPDFDEAILAMNLRMDQNIAVSRLRDPVLLTEQCRERYRRYLSGRIMPRAEQAVAAGDTSALAEMVSTGMFDDDAVRLLMERSLRSGKTAVTSMLMSVLYSRRM